MARTLKDILRQAHATIKGVHASTTAPLSLGKDPGVDYDPKAPAEQDFVAKHSVQKWDDPYENPNYADKVKEAPFKKQKKGVYESKKAEDAQCNRSPKGTGCPMHGLAECMTARTIKEDEPITELSKDTLKSYKEKQLFSKDKSPTQSYNRLVGSARATRKIAAKEKANEEVKLDELSPPTLASYTRKAASQATKIPLLSKDAEDRGDEAGAKRLNRKFSNRMGGIRTATQKLANEEVDQIDEVITKQTPPGQVIKDFQKSTNPKFAGKSAEKRKQMALAAYYAKQREPKKGVKEDLGEGHVPDEYSQSRVSNSGLTKSDASTMSKLSTLMSKEKAAQAAKKKPPVKEDLAMPLLGGTGRDDSDESAEMAKTQLKALANKALHLMMQMDDDMRVEPWVQAKIATAKELVSSVHDYMIYRDPKPEDEQMDTPMTFPNMSADVNTGRNV